MKKILFVIFVISAMCNSYAQTTLTSQNSENQLWIKLGDLALPQGGNDCFLRIVGGSGYNASKYQQGYIELHMRTSNGVSVDENGYAFSATAVSYERGRFISDIKIVPNTNGASYGIFIHCGPYPGNTYFTVEDPTGVWTPGLSNSTSNPGGYNVPFEHVINNDTFLNGNLSIGTTDPKGYMLAVAGNAVAESLTVKLQSQWPDFVFKPSYKLPSLIQVKAYLDRKNHLPDMPSESEVEKNGVNVGEMLKLQTKKIEELTLYLIEKDKQVAEQKKQVAEQNKRLKKQEARLMALEAKINNNLSSINKLR